MVPAVDPHKLNSTNTDTDSINNAKLKLVTQIASDAFTLQSNCASLEVVGEA